jgi:hypothetical protein
MKLSFSRTQLVAWLLLVLFSVGGTVGCREENTPAASNAVEQTVYVTRTGKKYHKAGCQYLHGEGITQPLSVAQKTLTPCAVCKP